MGTGNAQSILIGLHDHTPGLGSLKDRDTQKSCLSDLGIVVVRCSGTDDAGCALHIFRSVADGDLNALGDQLVGGHGRIHIRTGHLQTHALENQAQRTHGHAADAHKMYMGAGDKILLQFFASIIHNQRTP